MREPLCETNDKEALHEEADLPPKVALLILIVEESRGADDGGAAAVAERSWVIREDQQEEQRHLPWRDIAFCQFRAEAAVKKWPRSVTGKQLFKFDATISCDGPHVKAKCNASMNAAALTPIGHKATSKYASLLTRS